MKSTSEPAKAEHRIAAPAADRGGLVPAWSDDDLVGTTTERFIRVAEAVPHRVALVGGEEDVYTFAELHDASLRVAGAILDKLGPGTDNVALYATPGVAGVVGMLGILAAGKAYLPLDPFEPLARATPKIEDAGARAIVAPGPLAGEASSLLGSEDSVISLDDLPVATSSGRSVLAQTDDRLNLIYTSGSTGAPKGVVQTHRNVLFDTATSLEMMHVDENDRFGLIVPLTFGASVSDVMGAILNGAALHVLDLRRHGIDVMARWMHDDAITITHLVPTVFRRWMASIDVDVQYPAMRMVKAGGEPLLRGDLDAFKLHFGERCVLRNGLGTTETYLVAAEMFTRDDVCEGPVLPVGSPMAGRSVTILGERGEPMSPGEIGQIAVTSRYLSPGYWKDDEATSRVFIRDPDPSGERTYLTGDIGRIRPDGRLEHMGRIDDMVKIRGQRVDLSEVETLILAQTGVAEVTVLAEAAPSGEYRLVAYVVPGADPLAASALREGLAGMLAPHMIPTRFVWMEQLPTLSFGKVDRRSLQEREQRSSTIDVEYLAPRDADEEFIASCVIAVLEIERVGVNDDLFELGLDSLSGAQLIGRISEGLEIPLPIEAVFRAPSVAGLAALARAGSAAQIEGDIGLLLDELDGLEEEVAQEMVGERPT